MNFVDLFLYVIVPASVAVFFFLKKKYDYFEERGIPYTKPSFLLGNMMGIGTKKHMLDLIHELYDEHKGKDVMHGFYTLFSPSLYVTDLDLIKNILVKDFNNFMDRGMYVNEEGDPLSAHLFSIEPEKWRFLRNKLSPVFTSGRIKALFNIISTNGVNFVEALKKETKKNVSIDCKHFATCFTADIISSGVFGMDANTLKGEHPEMLEIIKKVFEDFAPFKFFVLFAFPKIAKFFNMRNFSKEVNDYFFDVIGGNIKYREENNVTRKDFLDMLIQLKNKGTIDGEISTEVGKLTLDQSVAQAFLFFFAGSETSSTAISFALLELARYPEIQEKLRKEVIEKTKETKGEITYDNLHEMTYLTQVMNETLRKYPPALLLSRKALNDYKVPGTKHVIQAGTQIMIPTCSIQMDERYFDNPHEFRPERFSQAEIEKRPNFVFTPFGDGPRNCIGMRLAHINVKYALAIIVQHFIVEADSRVKFPIKLDPASPAFAPREGFWVRMKSIEA